MACLFGCHGTDTNILDLIGQVNRASRPVVKRPLSAAFKETGPVLCRNNPRRGEGQSNGDLINGPCT